MTLMIISSSLVPNNCRVLESPGESWRVLVSSQQLQERPQCSPVLQQNSEECLRVQLLKLSPLPPSEDEHLSISGWRSRLSSHCTAVQDLIIWKFFTENCMNLTRWKKETINSINVQIQGLSTRARNELKSERERK